MNGRRPGWLKLECGVEINRSATRFPISCGELPAGHFLNSFGCCSPVRQLPPSSSKQPTTTRLFCGIDSLLVPLCPRDLTSESLKCRANS